MTNICSRAGVIGLIAGQGCLPRLIAQKLLSIKHPFVVLSYTSEIFNVKDGDVPCAQLSLGQVGQALNFLKKHNVTSLVMAGAFKRPAFRDLKVDLKGGIWLSGLLKEPSGDDHLLRYLTRKLEGEGFSVVSPQSIVAHVLQPAGLLSGPPISEKEHAWIHRGFELLETLSPFDVGQALTLEEGWILGIEALEGTDALIERSGLLMRHPGSAFLLKAPKIGQDARLDPPALGLDTLKVLSLNNFKGVIFKAGQTLLLEPERMKTFAQEVGLVVYGVESVMKGTTFEKSGM